MTHPFDLLREPFIPVVRGDGLRVTVRLTEITTPHEGHPLVRIDSGRADIDTSLTEFLIGLLAVTLDPVITKVHWIKRWTAPPSKAELESACKPFAKAFVLDGPGPRFFQDLAELEGDTTPVSALFIDAPAQHFVKPGGVVALSRRGAAMALLTLQTSAPAGGAGHRTSLRGGGPLTTIVVPGGEGNASPTLWHRLWANVPERYGASANEIGAVFPWTAPTRTSEKGSVTEVTYPDDVHKAQAFFGLPRRIRLVFEPNAKHLPCALTGEIDDVVVTSYVTRPRGANYEGWGRHHPLSPCYRPKPKEPGFLPEHLKSARVGYRDWIGYVFKGPVSGDAVSSLPADAVRTFYTQRYSDLYDVDEAAAAKARLQVCGYVLENMKPLEYGEALLPLLGLPPGMSNAERELMVERLSRQAHSFVEAAEEASSVLSAAGRRGLYGEAPKVDSGATALSAVKASLWADTERAFYVLMRDAPKAMTGEPLSRSWLDELRRVALALFDDAVPIDSAGTRSPDAYKQIVDARSQLVAAFAGLTPGGKKIYKALGLEVTQKPSTKNKARTTP